MLSIVYQKTEQSLSYDDDMKKKLDSYKIEESEQMSIFEVIESGQYSNSVDILDLLPRFLNKNPKSHDGRLEPIRYYPTVKIGGVDLRLEVTITPARIENREGRFVDMFPTAREKVVELGIRKIAFSGEGRLFNGQAGTLFTLRQLHRLLEDNNRGYGMKDINEAIEVLRKTSMDIKCLSDDLFPRVSVNYISDSYIQTKQAYHAGVNDSKCFVVFNTLVTDSVNAKTLRAYNYKQLFRYKNNLADYIHFRITRNMIHAKYNGRDNQFRISQTTLQRDSAFEVYANYRDNKRQVITALDRMQKEGAIDRHWHKDEKEGRKIVNTMYFMEVSEQFCNEIIEANIRINDKRTFTEHMETAKKRIDKEK